MRIDKRSFILTVTLASSGLAFLLATARPAPAWPPYFTDWQTAYPSSQTDDNVIAVHGQGCAVCHFSPFGGTGWNPYGWEIRQKFLAGMTIPQAIQAAALWDSDDNPMSWSNITEVNGDTQPGWTDGNNNIEYTDSGTLTGQPAPSINGSLDPAVSPMTPYCDPGAAGIIVCPCNNPSSGLNRGCDNSSQTTGAAITAVGNASLASDTLVFTTGGERPTALTIFIQGPFQHAAGLVYGQGVRCVQGTLLRLYMKNAAGGSIVVPSGAQPSISARSAAKGDTIPPGTNRRYFAYYRDPFVLGGCPTSSTFNTTSAGLVTWQP